MVRRICLYCIVALIAIATSTNALVINEVLANEPQLQRSLEWLEIYNPVDSIFDLSDFYLVIAGNVLPINESVNVGADEYVVICRKLIGDSNSDGFESYWGDNSGIWGDSPDELAMIAPVEVPISLRNDGDTILLYDKSDELYSTFVWTSIGADGYSWERLNAFSDSILQSQEVSGSSPGSANSVLLFERDLAIEDVTIRKTNCTATQFEIVIQSHSRQIVEFATLWIHYQLGDTLTFVGLPPVKPDSSYSVSGEIILSGEYVELEISLSSDDRDNNNHVTRMFAGDSYHPLNLNELMVNPPESIGSEWVELTNNSDNWIDLLGYSLIVGDDLEQITDLSLSLAPGEYHLLVQNRQSFTNYYGVGMNVSGLTIWNVMRNSSDTIKLIDPFGIIADELVYYDLPESGYTLSRDNLNNDNCRWGFSADYGGTPGAFNRSFFIPDDEQLALMVEPNIFSRTGSRPDSEILITLKAPTADYYTLAIYDRYGRLVRTFFHDETQIPDRIYWDGRADSGNQLPIGIYIILGEAGGIGSVKETVVIAP